MPVPGDDPGDAGSAGVKRFRLVRIADERPYLLLGNYPLQPIHVHLLDKFVDTLITIGPLEFCVKGGKIIVNRSCLRVVLFPDYPTESTPICPVVFPALLKRGWRPGKTLPLAHLAATSISGLSPHGESTKSALLDIVVQEGFFLLPAHHPLPSTVPRQFFLPVTGRRRGSSGGVFVRPMPTRFASDRGDAMNGSQRIVTASLFAACFCMMLACGGCAGRKELEDKVLAANRLWITGDKAGAVREYKKLYGATWMTRGEKEMLMERIVEFEAKEGTLDEAKTWIKRGLEEKVTPEYENAEVKAIFAEVKKQYDATIAREKQEREERAARRELQTKWWKGGTLHKKSILEWQDADARDKLATCADFVGGTWKDGNFIPKIQNSIVTVDDMRPYAEELVAFIDAAGKRHENAKQNEILYANQDVAGFASLGVVTMKWVK